MYRRQFDHAEVSIGHRSIGLFSSETLNARRSRGTTVVVDPIGHAVTTYFSSPGLRIAIGAYGFACLEWRSAYIGANDGLGSLAWGLLARHGRRQSRRPSRRPNSLTAPSLG